MAEHRTQPRRERSKLPSSTSTPAESNSRYRGWPPNYNSRKTYGSTSSIDKNVYSKKKIVSGGNCVKDTADDIDGETPLPSTSGTCPFMCPVEERLQRERLRDLAVFERLNGNPVKSSPNLAVKKFCRTISTRELQTSSVRPLSILEKTLEHLFGLWASSEHPFEVLHEFIFDRTRSIRQDLSMQGIINYQVISMYERMVKFHVLSHNKLQRSSNPDVPSMLHLNLEQLTKSLMTLFNLYEENRTSESIYENEAEFRSLYVLLHICPNNQATSLSLWFRLFPSAIMKSKEMCFARRILRYFRSGNYYRLLHITKSEASYLQYCIIEPCINEVRVFAICCLNHGGYKLQPYPLADLSKLLVLEDSDVESFCNDCGLETSADEVGTRYLPTGQTSFSNLKKRFQKYYPFDSERLQRLSIHSSVL